MMNLSRRCFGIVVVWMTVVPLWVMSSSPAYAIPSFTRQTGMQCATCHTVFPELNAFGRQFKLRGYTMGSGLQDQSFPYNLPLAAGLQVANTAVSDRAKGADANEDFPRAGKTIVQQVAFYYGGKIYGKVGAMAQYNYDGIEQKWGAEMADIRYADSTTVKGKDFTYGLSVANSPTLPDLWATTPMWAFPHLQSAGILPMQTSLFDMTLDNQVGVVTLYGFYDSRFYGALGLLHNGRKGIFRPLNAGHTTETAIDGNAPHLRLAWEQHWGTHSLTLGLHALRADVFPDPEIQSGPTDRFTDFALDGQYHYTGGEHLFSLHAFLDREKRDWDASFPAGNASHPSDDLNTLKVNAHYWYQRKVGGGIGFFDYRGDSDMLKYGMGGMPSATGNASGSPDTRGWIIEGDWLPLPSEQNLKLGLRYTAYNKFNGASDNYNGFGRNASDNNEWFTYLWLLY